MRVTANSASQRAATFTASAGAQILSIDRDEAAVSIKLEGAPADGLRGTARSTALLGVPMARRSALPCAVYILVRELLLFVGSNVEYRTRFTDSENSLWCRNGNGCRWVCFRRHRGHRQQRAGVPRSTQRSSWGAFQSR